MKRAFLNDLQAELVGHVTDAPDVLRAYATDGSIFTQTPTGVIFPRNAADVRRAVTFLAARAKAGKPVGITARGKGTDQSGGAIGEGIVLVIPAHMDRLVKLDKYTVTVQPGINYGALQQILGSHDRYIPPYPASLEYSTIGGAVGNNAGGEKSVKYGATRQWVRGLKVVLSDGSIIETKRLTPRELNRKKGQTDLEGDIYRGVDGLLLDNAEALSKAAPQTTKNAAGYALWRVRASDGSFDLTPLIVGSQGTLGIVTEVTLATAVCPPRTALIAVYFNNLDQAGEAICLLQQLKPSALELVDYHLLEYVRQHRPTDIDGLVPDELPKLVILVEFDDVSQVQQAIKTRRAERIIRKYANGSKAATTPVQQQALWKLRRSAAAVMWMNHSSRQAVPVIEDGVVPLAKLPQFIRELGKLLEKHNLEAAIWGHAGDANLHLQPFIDLSRRSDVTKLFMLADDFYALVIKLGGSTSGEHNDGLLRGPYLEQLYGREVVDLFRATKQLFDPLNILNPGKKHDATREIQKESLRKEYSMKQLYDHLPHS